MCISTIWIRKHQQEVPCGRCYECVKRRRNDWYIRCAIQSYNSRYTYFGLLTYAEVGMSLEKRDIQLFLKRLRAYGYKFSYLIAGEHGEKKDRPHWHCLFFSEIPLPFAHIAKAWRGGYHNDPNCNKAGWVNFSPIRSLKSVRYTVKYLYKYDGNDPRFVLMMSKNPAIGHSYLKQQSLFLSQRISKITFNGAHMALPRYYKRKFFDDYPDIKEEVNSKLADKVRELADSEIKMAAVLHPNANLTELENIIKNQKLERNEYFRRFEKISRHIRKIKLPC